MKTIEGHKLFPYIAWTTVVLFSLFTYSLVLQLQSTVKHLEERTEMNVSALHEA